MSPSRINPDKGEKTASRHKKLDQYFHLPPGGLPVTIQAKMVSGNGTNRPMEAAPGDTNPSSAKARRGAEGSHTKTPETSPKQTTLEEEARTLPHGKASATSSPGKTGKDGTMGGMEVEEEENSPLQGVYLNKKFQGDEPQDQPLVLDGLHFSSTGTFPDTADGLDPQLGPASDLYKGENALKHLIISYVGRYSGFVTKQTNFIIVGIKPSKKFLKKAQELKTDLILYSPLAGMINGSVNPECKAFEEVPEIVEHSQGYNLPAIQRNINLPGTDKVAAAKVTFSGIRLRKCKEAATPEGTPEHANLVAGSELIRQRGVLDTFKLGKKACRYASVVHATLWVPQGDVKDLTMELLFMGLDTLRGEDKTVCLLHPNNPSLHAKKQQDMPPKFQRIHAEWMVFDQSITHFKNNIKERCKHTYNISFWLGSKKPAQMLLDSCILEWDETQSNRGIVKITYKHVQSLHTAWNLILVGVPTNLDTDALQLLLKSKMEDARQKLVVKNPYNYCAITKVPEFVLERDFIKHTPYAKWSKEDDIPFWARMALHLEYLLKDKDMLKQILAFMYCTKQFQGILGKRPFTIKILGLIPWLVIGKSLQES
jgi:hypothetical protein